MSHTISRRTHEIGVRVANGAESRDILKLVIGHGCGLASIGVAAGTAGSLGLTHLIETFLYGVEQTDPTTFLIVTLVLLGAALGACWVPARRATRIDPLTALRQE
jgi:putative ABC transport system permease protein